MRWKMRGRRKNGRKRIRSIKGAAGGGGARA